MVEYVDLKDILSRFPQRPENSHKGTFGSILNISGSKRYIGAAFLSSVSALKTGAGYITLACPESIVPIIASMAPEVTFLPMLETASGTISSSNNISDLSKYNVISLGCGITTDSDTKVFVQNVINNISEFQNLIVDADGINIIASDSSNYTLKNAIITPHPKELSRLLNISVEEIEKDREKYAVYAAQKYNCVVVLKGHESVVTNGNYVYINKTGSSALAKAGSGDVLTGIISGLTAQKMSPFCAAATGVYIHGLSGDFASETLTKYCVLARDIIDYIPQAIQIIINHKQV